MKPIYAALPLAVAVVVLAIGISIGPLGVVQLTTPLRTATNQLNDNLGRFGQWFSDINTMRQDYEKLAMERNQLAAKVAQLETQSRENEALRTQLKLPTSLQQNSLMTRVIGTVQNGQVTYLQIAAGQSSGLKEGQIVLSNGVLVGRIKQVAATISLVQTPQSVGATIPAVVRHGDTVAKGLVVGKFNITAQIGKILPTDPIAEGDMILTSAEGGLYPPDLVVGKVGKITSSPQDVFQEAQVEMLWKIGELEYVFVQT